MRHTLLAIATLLVPMFAAPAYALQQPNGESIPTAPGCSGNQPTGLLAAFACACSQPGVCNIGAPCTSQTSCDDGMHGTCESTMWHVFNDNTCIPSKSSGIDPANDAAVMPETFHPTCALTFKVVTRGTAMFQNVFGWYNVTGSQPDASDLHPMIGCTDAAGTSTILDIQHEPAYKGGDIGFFLLTPESRSAHATCASSNCCPSLSRLASGEGYVYYSQRAWNPDGAGANPFIHLLIYDSHIVQRKFYFAWEDTFDTTSANFTDLVTSVEGVECSGGGEACDTGQKGVCANGISQCSKGAIGCTPIVQPKAETCDGLDDDCNGIVDDGATCPTGEVCQNGKCVGHCGSSEFKCPANTQCDNSTGLCVDPICIGVSCAADKVCAGGTCVAACEGVVCPLGQTCVGNACVDLCAGVSCAPGQVCKDGVCFAGCSSCSGIVCGAPLACDAASGACVDPSCATPCSAGSVCKSGQCVDACDGVKCPMNLACSSGQCVAAAAPDAGGLAPIGPTGGQSDGGVVGAGSDGGQEAAFGDSGSSGCAFAARDRDARGGVAVIVLACAATIAARRRRR
jgi:hypothetical protein